MQASSTVLDKAKQTILKKYEEADRLAFFEMFYAAFQDALENVGESTDFYYRLAGQTIR